MVLATLDAVTIVTCTKLLDQVPYNNIMSYLLLPYPHERGPTTEYWPTPHFGLNLLLRSCAYSNMQCVAALDNGAQMAGL